MVNQDKDLVFTTFQIVAPSFECPKNSEKVLIVSLVPSFCRNLFSGKKNYKILLSNFVLREF